MTHCPAALLPGLSVDVFATALKIIPCISRVPSGTLLSARWLPRICSIDQCGASGLRTGIRIGRSPSHQVSGLDAIVRYRPVSP